MWQQDKPVICPALLFCKQDTFRCQTDKLVCRTKMRWLVIMADADDMLCQSARRRTGKAIMHKGDICPFASRRISEQRGQVPHNYPAARGKQATLSPWVIVGQPPAKSVIRRDGGKAIWRIFQYHGCPVYQSTLDTAFCLV